MIYLRLLRSVTLPVWHLALLNDGSRITARIPLIAMMTRSSSTCNLGRILRH